MAVDQSTIDAITKWYNDGASPQSSTSSWANATGTPSATTTSKPTGMLGSTSTTNSASTPADVGSWYRSALGRDGAETGIKFWTDAIANNGGDTEKTYQQFLNGARANGEVVKTTDYSKANSYTGPQSVNTATPVDDWARNVMGRNLNPSELASWQAKFAEGGKSGATGAQKVYDEFLATYGNEVKNPMDWKTASQINSVKQNPIPIGPTYLDVNSLAKRTIDPATETVRGQMSSLLKEDSPYMQQARYDAMKAAADRGLLNTTMAASGGEDAAIRSALNIATPDAATYGKASDYNTAMTNQATMWNAEAANNFASQQQSADNQMALQKNQFLNQVELQKMQNGQQLTLAELTDATERWKTQVSDATSRYNTDAQYKQQADSNKRSLTNNIMMNMDLSPDRKAAMLEALGEGTSAKMVNGVMVPGTGLAGAVYIMNDVGQELREGAPVGWGDVAGDIISGQNGG